MNQLSTSIIVIKNLPVGIKIEIPVNYGYFVGLSKVREPLYNQVIVWVNTILNHIDARAILPRYEGFCMVYRSEWY